MRIGKDEVEYLADLAGIELSEAEKELFSHQLFRIIEYVEKLNELDLENVPPTAHTKILSNVFRKDVCEPGLTQEAALSLAVR